MNPYVVFRAWLTPDLSRAFPGCRSLRSGQLSAHLDVSTASAPSPAPVHSPACRPCSSEQPEVSCPHASHQVCLSSYRARSWLSGMTRPELERAPFHMGSTCLRTRPLLGPHRPTAPHTCPQVLPVPCPWGSLTCKLVPEPGGFFLSLRCAPSSYAPFLALGAVPDSGVPHSCSTSASLCCPISSFSMKASRQEALRKNLKVCDIAVRPLPPSHLSLETSFFLFLHVPF